MLAQFKIIIEFFELLEAIFYGNISWLSSFVRCIPLHWQYGINFVLHVTLSFQTIDKIRRFSFQYVQFTVSEIKCLLNMNFLNIWNLWKSSFQWYQLLSYNFLENSLFCFILASKDRSSFLHNSILFSASLILSVNCLIFRYLWNSFGNKLVDDVWK